MVTTIRIAPTAVAVNVTVLQVYLQMINRINSKNRQKYKKNIEIREKLI
jgi:hypothetical protein